MSWAFAAAGISRSAINGPPGAARIMKNVRVAIAHSVGMKSSRRRTTNPTTRQRPTATVEGPTRGPWSIHTPLSVWVSSALGWIPCT